MSAITVVGEIIKWAGHTMKLMGTGVAICESVQAAQDDDLSTGEKVAIIGTNSLFAALQVADLGMDVHSTVSNYSRPEGPIEVKIVKVEAVEGAGSGPGWIRIPEGSELACPYRPDPNSVDFGGHVIPGCRTPNPVSPPDQAILDSMIPLGSGPRPNISAERLKNSRSKESENYKHVRTAVKGAVGAADIGRHVVKKVCKIRRQGLDIYDYLDLLGVVCSRSAESVGFSAETYPQAFAGHEKTVETVSNILSNGSAILLNARLIELLGKLIIEKITKKSDSSASQTSSKAESLDSCVSQSHDGEKKNSDTKSELFSKPTSSAPPSDEEIESSDSSSSQSQDDANKDLEFGKAILAEIQEVILIEDLSQLQSIPKLFSEAEVFQRYSCGMCGTPVRFVMMVQENVKSLPVFYEKKYLEEWFATIPNKKPPKWPESLKDWSWQDVVDFNEDNYSVNRAQEIIDEKLKEMISEVKSYNITVYK